MISKFTFCLQGGLVGPVAQTQIIWHKLFTLWVNQLTCVRLVFVFQHVRICTCLIRYVGHVVGVMFDCFFIMFQRCFKVLILICRIPKFFFLQGLLKKALWLIWLLKKNTRVGIHQTGQKMYENSIKIEIRMNWLTCLLFSGRSSSLGGGGWVSLGLGGGGGVGSSSSISERFSPNSTESVVITLGSWSFLQNSQTSECITNTTVFRTSAHFFQINLTFLILLHLILLWPFFSIIHAL